MAGIVNNRINAAMLIHRHFHESFQIGWLQNRPCVTKSTQFLTQSFAFAG